MILNPSQQKWFHLNFVTLSQPTTVTSPPTDPEGFYVDEDETYQEMELDTPIDPSTGVPQMVFTKGDKKNLEEEWTKLEGKHSI